jgi:hypothetical protein
MEQIDGSAFSFAAVNAWEIELMLKLQQTESDYSSIPVKERARLIAGMHYREWGQTLLMEQQRAKHGELYKDKG